jgi:hypothetical protein
MFYGSLVGLEEDMTNYSVYFLYGSSEVEIELELRGVIFPLKFII